MRTATEPKSDELAHGSLPKLLISSVSFGAATYGTLSLLAPSYSASATVAALATLLFVLVIVVTHRLLTGPRRRGAPITAKAAEGEHVLSSASDPATPGSVVNPTLPAPLQNLQSVELQSIADTAARLYSLQQRTAIGARSLIATEVPVASVATEIVSLADELARYGQTVIIVDWADADSSLAEFFERPSTPGFTDVAKNQAAFEDAIIPLAMVSAHFLPAGSAEELPALDEADVNAILDALDNVYEQILIVAGFHSAAALLQAIDGRVDAGITVTGPRSQIVAPPGTFLGFEVDGMELISHKVQASNSTAGRRMARAV